jgi:hypothetical protein
MLWANGTNYPAGSNTYNGTPIKVDPNYAYFTPDQASTAQEMNQILNAISVQSSVGGAVPGVSWGATFTASATAGYVNFYGGAWDPVGNTWLVCAGSSGTVSSNVFLAYGVNDAGGWSSVDNGAGALGFATSAAFDGTNYFGAFCTTSVADIYHCTFGGAWTLGFNSAGAGLSSTTLPIGVLTVFAGRVVGAFAGTFPGSIGAFVAYETTPGTPSSWSVPVTKIGGAYGDIFMAQSSALLVVMPQGGPPTNYMTSPDGTTWTLQSTAFLASGEQPNGLVYSPADGAFVLVTGTGSRMNTYQSQDGVNWTQVSSISSFTGSRGLGVNNSSCLAVTVSVAAGLRILYSPDGGFTWRMAAAPLVFTGGAINARLYGSPSQFLVFSNPNARWSHAAGLGPALA